MPIVSGALSAVTKGLVQGLEDLEIRNNYSIIKLDQNTEKSPEHLRRFAFT